MKIEEAIKQKAFKDEYQKLAVNLMFTEAWLAGIQNQFLKEYDLSIQQFNILRILRGSKGAPMAMQNISERMIDRMSNCSRLVEKLRIKNMLERRECPADRRQVDILITQKGLDVLAEIDKSMKKMNEHLHSITEKEAQTLNNLLDKLRG